MPTPVPSAPPSVPAAPVVKLEQLECEVSAACIRAAHKMDDRAAVADIAGGKAMLMAPDSPMNSVKGVGMAGPVGRADLDAIANFFASRGSKAPVPFDACPFADDSLHTLISQRGWPLAGFEQVLWRVIAPSQPDPVPHVIPGITIAPINERRAEEWALVLARVFSGLESPPQWQIDIGLRTFSAEGGTAWAAIHGGKIIGAARSFIYRRAAALSGAAVLTEFRKRGLQTAMLLTRLRAAATQGCDVCKIDTKPGTTSQRNVQRLGFHVAYTRAQFMMPIV
jgi:GNAT superfamily N-acetyltransferase